MTTITLRPFVGETDLELMSELINACEVVDQLEEGISVDELRTELDEPGMDKQRNIRLWEDADGQLLGFGLLYVPPTGDKVDGSTWFKVRPDARGAGIETQILEWAEERTREVGRERSQPAELRGASRTDKPERMALLEAHGFKVARYFLRMARPLDQPIPEPHLPDGFSLRHLAGPEEAAAWVESFNQSFIDHYNHHPMTVEARTHWMSESIYRAERDLIAVAADRTIAAFCWCTINPDENRRNGRNEGWIGILGTRRGFRKLGLGRAMLLAGLHRLKADGVEIAQLGVDAESPTGALRLYESCGFQMRHTFVSYMKELR